ncbi:MAG: hypothetical protein HY360_06015 [Verrucomicrobia bacterium]|nr:hypothetical protein [Verrucomicrobiota bacterium]
MTHREQMLAAIRGEPTDQIPWAPRMDLWCIAQRERGTLPREFVGLNIAEIADVLGAACHALRADYTLKREARDLALRGFGIEDHPDYPLRVELRGLPVEFRQDGEFFRTTIQTDAGNVTTLLQHTAEMKRDGISMPFVKEFAIRSVADFEAIAQIFEHLEVIPMPDRYAAFRRRIGERGIAVGNGPIGASPMHQIFHELVPQEQFFYLYADERDALRRLAARMEPFYFKVLEAVAACEAEVVFWGANYDQNLTWPAFFKTEIAPWLKKAGDRLRACGKFLLTHTDGENQKLLPLYPSCDLDVAESVCPHPMTLCTLAEVRKGMGPKTTVWGGIPSIALLPSSMDDQKFEAYFDDLFAQLGRGDRLILGVSDNVPPDADLSRLRRIQERIRAFGPVRPVQIRA